MKLTGNQRERVNQYLGGTPYENWPVDLKRMAERITGGDEALSVVTAYVLDGERRELSPRQIINVLENRKSV